MFSFPRFLFVSGRCSVGEGSYGSVSTDRDTLDYGEVRSFRRVAAGRDVMQWVVSCYDLEGCGGDTS